MDFDIGICLGWSRKGDILKAAKQFKKAKEIIHTIASKIGDEELENTFLNSKQVQAVLTA